MSSSLSSSKKKRAPEAVDSSAGGEDVAMVDAPAVSLAGEGVKEREYDMHNPATPPPTEQRIRILHGSTEKAASFEFQHEDHTLGNALRYIIMKNPDVEFCGYSIPHPSEPVMNIRIQTYVGTAYEALEKGFNDLEDLCEVVADTFIKARSAFVDEKITKE